MAKKTYFLIFFLLFKQTDDENKENLNSGMEIFSLFHQILTSSTNMIVLLS